MPFAKTVDRPFRIIVLPARAPAARPGEPRPHVLAGAVPQPADTFVRTAVPPAETQRGMASDAGSRYLRADAHLQALVARRSGALDEIGRTRLAESQAAFAAFREAQAALQAEVLAGGGSMATVTRFGALRRLTAEQADFVHRGHSRYDAELQRVDVPALRARLRTAESQLHAVMETLGERVDPSLYPRLEAVRQAFEAHLDKASLFAAYPRADAPMATAKLLREAVAQAEAQTLRLENLLEENREEGNL